MARSQFDRGWDAMGDRNEALWDLGAQTEEERRMIAELEGQMANANRIDDDGDFWPWPDRGWVMNDVSPLSRTITEGVLAFARAVQRYEIPTYSAFRSATESIRRSNPSADSVEFKGSAGNMLFYNSISSGIARDFGNLRIRNQMHFYPRKADYKKELRDGDTMAESPSRQPMVTLLDGTHAYLDEPLALTNDRATVPRLWYTDANDVVKGRGPSVRIRPSVNGQPMHAVVDANESIDFVLSEVTRGSLLAANLKDLTLFDENGQKMSQHHKLRTLAPLRASLMVDTWHSPLHRIIDFGGLQHTPVDILHVASLGAGKYLAKLTDKLLTHAAKDHLRVRLEGVSTTAITGSAAYPAATMMRKLNTLNGKQVKVLAQLMPFALAPLIEDEMAPETLLEAWISYARLSRLLYVEYIPSIDIYQEDLQSAIRSLWLAWATLQPQDLTFKLKLHMLAHVATQVRLFGPLKNVATERYESHNAVQRQAACHTNRSAPSKDVARRMEGQEMTMHWSSNGALEDRTNGKIQRPGPLLSNLIQDRSLKVIKTRWITGEEEEMQPESVERLSSPRIKLCDPVAAGFDLKTEGAQLPAHDDNAEFYSCKSFTVAQIQSIWSAIAGGAVLVRVKLFSIKRRTSYGCVEISSSGTSSVFEGKRIVQLLNVQHNCIGCKCKVNATAGRMRVERQESDILLPAMQHSGSRAAVQRYVLNEFLHRSPAVEQAHLSAVITSMETPELDEIVEEAMKTMPSGRKKGNTASRKRARRDDQDVDEFASAEEETDEE
ncbi:unnamed protein product [Tilletia controversa]|nr:unnamed protein product [Tilletia controversa]